MKRQIQNRIAILLAAITIASTTTWAVRQAMDKHEVAKRFEHEAARMTEKMKTVCVGRFLIDLPEEAQVELSHARIHGFDIAAFAEPIVEFQTRLAQREADIHSTPDRLGGNRNLELVKNVKIESGVSGKMFVHGRTVTEGTRAKGLELERYRYEGVAAEALIHGKGISIDLASDDYDPNHVENLSRLVAKVVPSPDNRIPGESGFCMGRAFVRDPLKADQHERVTLFARLPSHPDIEFLLILAAGLKPDQKGLLERDFAADALTSLVERARISKLRAAPRTIAGLSGDELARRVVEDDGAHVYSFWWEVNGKEDDVFVPHFVFKMNTGKGQNGPVPTSVSEGTALGLWDKVSSSIRLHPAHKPRPPGAS